jgi:hypothetical protein
MRIPRRDAGWSSVDDDRQFSREDLEGFLVAHVVVFRWSLSGAQVERAVELAIRLFGGHEFGNPLPRHGIRNEGPGPFSEFLREGTVRIDLEPGPSDRVTGIIERSPYWCGDHGNY